MNFAIALAVAFGSGFIALSYEILWYRVFSFLTWSSPATFGMLLGFYLAGLANGALRSRAHCTDGGTGDPAQLRTVARYLVLGGVCAYLVAPLLGVLAQSDRLWVAGYGLVAAAATLLGTVLPLTSHFGIAPDERAGQRLSFLYVANIVGSALGSLLTGFVLLDALPLRTVSMLLLAVGLALAVALLAVARMPGRRAVREAGAALALGAVALAVGAPLGGTLWERLLFKERMRPEARFAETVENRSGVIAVTRDGRVFADGVYDGVFNTGLDGDRNSVARAYAVAALHPAPRDLLLIGLGTGSWAQVAVHVPGVANMTAIEINPGYLDLIARQPEVRSLLANPKVELVVDDGRRWLQRHPERRFDAIVMNTSWHFRAHATHLLSAEFLRIARAHLLPGGVLYYNTTDSADVIATALAEFPHALRYRNCIAVSDAPLRFDDARFRRMLTEVPIDGRPPLDPTRDQALLAKLLAHSDLEVGEALRARAAPGRPITDDNMRSEWRLPLTFIAGVSPDPSSD